MDLSLERVQEMVAYAAKKATMRYQRPICVAIYDRQGALVAFGRMDDAPERGVKIAQCRAYTSARMRMDTVAFDALLCEQNMPVAYYCDPQFTGIPGGCVLKAADGEVIGGVGISGLAATEDASISEIVAKSLA
jgi:glc operon protein GlcG